MKSDIVDWKMGTVRFWQIESLDETRPLADQPDELREDLGYVEYPGAVILDIGWYGGDFRRGLFKIYVVQDCNWEEPLLVTSCKTVAALKIALVEAVAVAAQASTRAAQH